MWSLSKPNAVLWPKLKTTDLYFDKKEDNCYSFDINLWQGNPDSKLEPLAAFLTQNKIEDLTIFVPDDVVVTKSFIYDSQISQIDAAEVSVLAQSAVQFKVDPESIEYSLLPTADKTIILAKIFNQAKLEVLRQNLSHFNLKTTNLVPVSSAVTQVMANFCDQKYFVIYPSHSRNYTLILAKGEAVYLTANLKGPSLEIQKVINYSNLYFSSPVNKVYYPQGEEIEVTATTALETTQFSESQIAQKLNKPANLPLPVLGIFQSSKKDSQADIIKPTTDYPLTTSQKTMEITENKKNILPLIAVFVLTASLASIAIWYVMNRNGEEEQLVSNVVPTEIPVYPTEIPTPTLVPVDKGLKIQVLNATSINGQAATLKNKLTELGFTDISVGNSTEKLTSNEIRLKSEFAAAQDYFTQSMPDFPATFTTDLKDSSKYDAVFLIGTNLSNPQASAADESDTTDTPAPTTKSTPTP
jgi:hypothetical protein